MGEDGTRAPGLDKVHPHSDFSLTSVLGALPCHPPVTLSLPPTTDALAESNDRGRGASEVQAVASGESAKTEERKVQVPVPSTPPPTTSAWTVESMGRI